jgi:hypothetical protein
MRWRSGDGRGGRKAEVVVAARRGRSEDGLLVVGQAAVELVTKESW